MDRYFFSFSCSENSCSENMFGRFEMNVPKGKLNLDEIERKIEEKFDVKGVVILFFTKI